jgi:glycosyltransferase involved in cell wall biosynthesis
MPNKTRILFIAGSIGECHGSAQSAVDIIRSLEGYFTTFIISSTPNACRGKVAGSFSPSPISQALAKPFIGRIISRLIPIKAITFLDAFLLRIYIYYSACDIVIVNGFGSISAWEKVRIFLSGKEITSVVSRESPRHFSQGDIGITLDQQKAFLSGFQYHIFVSKNLKNEWLSIISANPNKSFYLPNCCDESKFLAIQEGSNSKLSFRQELGIDQDCFLILNVGGLELRKGQYDLLALANLLSNNKLNFKIACVGPINSSLGQQLKMDIIESLVGCHFIFTGAISHVQPWYASADMLAFTSRAEAMPRTILEAMAAALPIISTDVDGIPELITHGSNGLLYQPGDISALHRLTERLVQDKSMAKEIGLAARSTYQAGFSRAHHKARLSEILHKISSCEACL